MDTIVAIISAIIAVIGAVISVWHAPYARIEMVAPYSQDKNEGELVEGYLGFQSTGSGPARNVKIETKHEGKWLQTRASDSWAALKPTEIIALRPLARISNRQPKAKLASGLGGTVDFLGLTHVRVSHRGRLWRHYKVFDIAKEHDRLGRATQPFEAVNMTLPPIA